MGGQIPAAMLHLLFRWVLLWAMLLLLIGSQLPVTHSRSSQEKKDSDEQRDIEHHFPATVEYALHIFNLQSKDSMAYKLVRILNSWKEQIEDILTFSMEIKLGRTECEKFDEDIDNCPFQESPELNNTITCFFTISTEPWRTKFELLNKTCLEDFL